MNSDSNPDETDGKPFDSIGSYQLHDARHLMAALAQAHIEFRADFTDGIKSAGSKGSNGRYAKVRLKVDPERIADVKNIQVQLFGDCLPDFEAGFFKHQQEAGLTEASECLAYHAEIPPGSTHCPKCGWTYEVTGAP